MNEMWILIAVLLICGIADLILKIIYVRQGRERVVVVSADSREWDGIGIKVDGKDVVQKKEKKRKLSPENGQYQ